MPPTDPAAPDPATTDSATTDSAAADPKQPSFAALTALRVSSNAAALNPANTSAAQDAAWKTYEAAGAQLEALDLAVFTGNTVQLQGAAATMTAGMNQLNDLKKQIDALGNDFKEAATVMADIDKAVSTLSTLV